MVYKGGMSERRKSLKSHVFHFLKDRIHNQFLTFCPSFKELHIFFIIYVKSFNKVGHTPLLLGLLSAPKLLRYFKISQHFGPWCMLQPTFTMPHLEPHLVNGAPISNLIIKFIIK